MHVYHLEKALLLFQHQSVCIYTDLKENIRSGIFGIVEIVTVSLLKVNIQEKVAVRVEDGWLQQISSGWRSLIRNPLGNAAKHPQGQEKSPLSIKLTQENCAAKPMFSFARSQPPPWLCIIQKCNHIQQPEQGNVCREGKERCSVTLRAAHPQKAPRPLEIRLAPCAQLALVSSAAGSQQYCKVSS